MTHHLLSVDQFSRDHLSRLFRLATRLREGTCWDTVPRRTVGANLFYEPSTRTSSSFYSAMTRLGGHMIPINDVSFSSVSKGETLEDTVRVMAGYTDVIVLRHPERGAARRAAAVSTVPIINGGYGVGEHPTQALLDLYTIHCHHDLQRPLRVALVGDLCHGRTVHSLLKLLRLYPTMIHLVAPEGLEMPRELTRPEDQHHRDLWGCISDVDVIYMTRVQRERMAPTVSHLVTSYGLDLELMQRAGSQVSLLHPLPRLGEIPPAIDSDPRARYFEQTQNGLWIRQAIFLSVFDRSIQPWDPVQL